MSSRTLAEGEGLHVLTQDDIVAVRARVRKRLRDMGFNLVDQTKFVTAVSEIARNAVVYGQQGEASVRPVVQGRREGLEVVIRDKGPGIEDVRRAQGVGYTTGGGLGLGLGGAERLVEVFEVETSPQGTSIRMVRWKR